ncbi:hypothetical protein EXIGLDRAFT_723991, partial [Exidia glandulosa HHB12029]
MPSHNSNLRRVLKVHTIRRLLGALITLNRLSPMDLAAVAAVVLLTQPRRPLQALYLHRMHGVLFCLRRLESPRRSLARNHILNRTQNFGIHLCAWGPCKAPFIDSSTLLKHIRAAHGLGSYKAFNCTVCDKRFPTSADLESHSYVEHPATSGRRISVDNSHRLLQGLLASAGVGVKRRSSDPFSPTSRSISSSPAPATPTSAVSTSAPIRTPTSSSASSTSAYSSSIDDSPRLTKRRRSDSSTESLSPHTPRTPDSNTFLSSTSP